jgi:hypothetical protein
MEQMRHLLNFRARSYGQFGASCTCCLVVARELQKTLQMLHQDDLSPAVISVHFSHLYRRDVPSIYTPHTVPPGSVKIFMNCD